MRASRFREYGMVDQLARALESLGPGLDFNDDLSGYADEYDPNLLYDMQFVKTKNVNILSRLHPDYPSSILEAMREESPTHLLSIGEHSMLREPSILICGTREASSTGRTFAYRCGGYAAQSGYLVSSGYARGTDTAAHHGALDAGGFTAAFLPYGFRKFHQRSELRDSFDFDRILLVSELPPSSGFHRSAALRRNQMLAAMTSATIVVEPGYNSGSLYTARYARQMNRPLFYFAGERLEVHEVMEELGGIHLDMPHDETGMYPVFDRLDIGASCA